MEKLAEALLDITEKLAAAVDVEDVEILLSMLDARQAVIDRADILMKEDPLRRFDGRAGELLSKVRVLDSEIQKKLLEKKQEIGGLLMQARKKKQAATSYYPSFQNPSGAFLDTNK